LTREDVEALINVCENSRTWKSRANTVSARPTAGRDQTIIRTLLDTGVRAGELCGMTYGGLNLSNNSIRIRGKGPGRDPKERQVYFGKRTGQALWKHLTPRLDTIKEADRVFTAVLSDPRPLTPTHLARLIRNLGRRAGVKKVRPHKFRHTFAINYLRNGGDLLTLQALLGHSSLDMVKRYARVAQTDLKEAHRKASPVDKWKV
jgi:integrase/recombinase XerD